MKTIDVAIIGGGLSGLLACKYSKAVGLNPVVFESTDDIGGVWKYREESNGKGGVMLSTVSTSSKSINEFADFPMPEEYPPFQKHSLILKYLNDYADHFDLRDHIRLNSEVIETRKIDDRWITQDNQGNTFSSTKLIVCSGMHQFPDRFYQSDPRFMNSNVKMIHSADYRHLKEEFIGKNILVFGGGETASDIAIELTHAAQSVTMAIPHGQWLFPSITPVQVPTNSSGSAAMVADTFSSRLRRLVDPPYATYKDKLETEAHFTSQTFIKWGGKCGHGIREWENDAPYYGQFFNKNSNVIQYVHRGLIIPKGNIDSIERGRANFSDGTNSQIDMIVFCVGYHTKFPFFSQPQYNQSINDQYKFMLSNSDTSLAFIGFARPLVGSFMGLSEMQSNCISKMFSSQIPIPNRDERDRVINEDKIYQELIFSATTSRIAGLVNFQSYMDDLATLAGVRPDYWKLFVDSPKKWFYAITAAHNNCQFLLNDQKHHDEIFKRYKYYHGDNLRVSTHIYALIVNIFPSLFTDRSSLFRRLANALNVLVECSLIALFSPVLLFRTFFPLEKRWRSRKRRMIENGRASALLEKVRSGHQIDVSVSFTENRGDEHSVATGEKQPGSPLVSTAD